MAEQAQNKTQTAASENAGTEISTEVSSERMFTESEARAMAEKAVRDRLAREQRKHEKALEEFKSSKTTNSSDKNVEKDFEAKLTDYESRFKKMSEKAQNYKSAALRGLLNTKASQYDVLDPEVFTEYLLSKKLVEWDDEIDDIKVNNVRNDLDDLLKDELKNKTYFLKPKGAGGTGSKPTAGLNKQATAAAKVDIKNMSPEEYSAWKTENGFGIGGGKGYFNFSKPKPN